MNDRKDVEKVRLALDTAFSSLRDDPWLARKVLAGAREEKKATKKLPIVLVFLLILILAAGIALAAALLWEQSVVPMKAIEQEEGDYIHWPLSQKQALIRALIASGDLAENDETARLFDDAASEAEKNALADQLVLTLTGQTDKKEISVDTITYAILGPADSWTPEQRVWWQQITNLFCSAQGAPDTLIAPTADDISEAEAVAIAKAAILEAYALPSDALDNALAVADLYVTGQRPDYRRWNVQFKLLREGDDQYVERVYAAIVDETGQVVDDPDVGINAPAKAAGRPARLASGYPDTPLFRPVDDLMRRAGNRIFQLWPLELKAEFSQAIAPQVRAVVESGDWSPLDNGGEPDLDIIAFSSYTYGLPGAQDITQEEAFDLAKHAVAAAYQLDAETLALYDAPCFYFDISAPDRRLWKIVFWPSFASAEKFPDGFASGQGHLRYKVEINAQTAEIEKMEAFDFQVFGGDLEYKLKLY